MTDQKTPDGPEATAPALTSKFTIAGRTYELVPSHKEGESSVTGDTMVERAQKLNANLGEEDGQFVLEHQAEIPQEFQGKFYLVFMAWRNPWPGVACLNWHGGPNYWYLRWVSLNRVWYKGVRLVRRVS